MLHKYSRLVVASTVLLILAGSFVTSTDSGLSVPDWPTTYGWNMFTFPPSKMVGGIFYEHGHRLIASTVGFMTIVLAAWLWMQDDRRWLKWFGVGALGAVVAQGLLGGLTVLFFLPPAVSTAHAGLAEIFFCMTVAIALFTSPGWIDGYESAGGPGAPGGPGGPGGPGVDDARLRRVATATTVVIFTQILIGATMRHIGAGLAIPDFPWMFGHLIPDRWSPAIAIHFAHRVGAVVTTIAILATTISVWRRHADRPELARPATFIIFLVAAQLMLGAFTVLSRRDIRINSLHVVCGALVLTTSLVITLRSWRIRFAIDDVHDRSVRLQADVTGGDAADSDAAIRLKPDAETVRARV
jgi:cytochrome c oxidase assembly protein subunit 15